MAYLKPQSPLKKEGDHIYPLTTADQVILSDGSRLEQDGVVVAGKLDAERTISLAGDVIGSVQFDGSTDVVVEASVFAANHYTATFLASAWSDSVPYTQTVSVSGIRSTDNPIVDIDMSSATADDGAALLEQWALIGRISSDTDSVTAYCYGSAPTLDISINVVTIK